jgi:Ca-activated chloride channel family protein
MRRIIGLAVICALGVRAEPAQTSTANSPEPTGGRLLTGVDDEKVDVPLAHTGVRIRIDGHLADTTVTQTFHNPYGDKINAVYLFPLPTGAAVNEMKITTSGRTIEGVVKKREEAVRTYERARKKGFVAALLTQERPNLFTQSVANIEPGAEVRVAIRFVQSLDYEQGRYELTFPMVAGPRYMPEASVQAGEAAAVQPQVLPPGTRSSHDIGLFVQIDAGVPVTAVESPSHEIDVTRDERTGRRAAVSIADGDTIPNKDFVLRYAVAGEAPEFAVLAHRDADGRDGSFMLIAQPPAGAGDDDVAPRELVFVLDTSSSMAGEPLAKAKQVIRQVLGGMRADDTFQIVRFDDGASALGPQPIANKPKNLRYVYDWLDALDAAGGTEMTTGLEAALAVPHDPLRLRLAVFLTDGYIGNEDEILELVANKMGEARLFSFGVGSAVNRYLLEEMAVLGRGAAQFVSPDEPTDEVVTRFYERIDRAVFTDVRIDWGELAVKDTVPAAIPDLFVGQPLVLTGHYSTPGRGTITVHGRRGGHDISFDVPVELPEARDRPAVASLWARRRITELSRALIRANDAAIEKQILELALAHRLMTRYTAFVAVDRSRITGGGDAKTVAVPVEVPKGVRSIARSSGAMGMMMGSGGFGMSGAGAGGGGVGYGTIGIGSYGTVGHGSSSAKGSGYGRGFGRGDDLAAPQKKEAARAVRPAVRIGAAVVRGSLDKAIIRRYIRKRLPAVKHCYEKQLTREPELEGTVTVKFVINAQGKVTSVVVKGLGNETVEKCVGSAIKSIEFPATGDGSIVQVSYPFVFRYAGSKEEQP